MAYYYVRTVVVALGKRRARPSLGFVPASCLRVSNAATVFKRTGGHAGAFGLTLRRARVVVKTRTGRVVDKRVRVPDGRAHGISFIYADGRFFVRIFRRRPTAAFKTPEYEIRALHCARARVRVRQRQYNGDRRTRQLRFFIVRNSPLVPCPRYCRVIYVPGGTVYRSRCPRTAAVVIRTARE